jgi:hypothetical protein
MSKRKDRVRVEAMYTAVQSTISPTEHRNSHSDEAISDDVLAQSATFAGLVAPQSATNAKRELTKMKKFRFQLLHTWMQTNLAPCRVADIGGGKGLLAYLLQRDGWESTVIDPVNQGLPVKYKDLANDRQIKVAETERVPRLSVPFSPELAGRFDLLVAMHAHGCNIQMIHAAREQNIPCLLLPCCVIDEPITPPPGTHWLACVADYARGVGFTVEPFRLNFKGQNIGLYLRPQAK